MRHRLRPLARRIALLVAAVVPAACGRDAPYTRFAAPWKHFLAGHDLAGAVDTSRLVRRGDTVDVWVRFQYAASPPLPGDAAGRTFSATEAAQSVHCASARTRDIRMLVRGAAGDSVSGFTAAAPEWQAFRAHALTEGVLQPLCEAVRRQR